MKGSEILWGICQILFKEKYFLKLIFLLLKIVENIVHVSSFVQVFLGLENLCENFNNIFGNAFNHGKFYYKNDNNFTLK
jgi:hypothetical protein